MKKLSILLLAVVGLGMTVTSCSKDDDKDKTPTVSAVGKWEAGTLEGTYGDQAVPAGTKDVLLTDKDCTSLAYYQFGATGTLEYGYYNSENACALEKSNAPYTIGTNNTSFSLTFDGESVTYPIVSITATQLKWRQQGTDTDGTPYNFVHVMNRK